MTGGLFAVVAVALAMSAVGASSTFALDIDARRRELSLLRALGCARRGVGFLVMWDAIVVGAAAFVAGTAAGLGAGEMGTRLVASVLGVQVDTALEPFTLLGVVGVVVVVMAGAASTPARRAMRVDPLEGLRGRA
jgi:putative ABC transport system permease protein